jgi:uncharacterized protein YuzE
MSEPYLEITFRHGRALAAYLYLPRPTGQKSYKTVQVGHGLLVDFSRSGKPIGIEITAPGRVSLAAINRILAEYDQPTLTQADLAPLSAA